MKKLLYIAAIAGLCVQAAFAAAPVAPTMIAPTDNQTAVALTPSFQWSWADTRIRGWVVQVSTSSIGFTTTSGFATTPVINYRNNGAANLTSPGSYTPTTPLAPTTKFYWSVQDSGYASASPYVFGPFAALDSFTTQAAVAPTLTGYSSGASVTYTQLTPITANTPTFTAGTPAATFSVSPALPVGLSLNTTTGVISGTPMASAAAASYTITLGNGYTTPVTYALTITVNTDGNYATGWSGSHVFAMNPSGTGITTNQINFPVLVRLTSTDPVFSSTTSPSDIRFAKGSSLTTHYPYQVARWDAVNKAAEIWVLVDTVFYQSTSQTITMYWGNASATTGSNGPGVFNQGSGFAAVWHLQDTTDAVGKLPLTGAAQPPANTTGIIGNSYTFNGTSTFFHTADSTSANATALNFANGSPFTLSAWEYDASTTPVQRMLVSKGGNNWDLGTRNATGKMCLLQTNATTGWIWDTTATAPSVGTWHHIAGVRTNAAGTSPGYADSLYIDGVLSIASPPIVSAGTTYTSTLSVCIGNQPDNNPAYCWSGQLDEVEIANVARTHDWVNLCYANQKSGQTFIAAVAATPPGVVTLSSPANAAVSVSIAPTLTWGTVSGAATYRVQLSTVSTFTSAVVDDSTLTAGSRAVSGLATVTTYYWRVDAKNTTGTGVWSTVFNFTTAVPAPVAPTLLTPANAATGIAVLPTLTWGTVTGAVTYRVQVAAVSDFSTITNEDSTLTAGTKTLTTTLSGSATYYWRANAKNAGGTSAYSTLFSFSTVSAASGTPTLLLPANGATDVVLAPTLTWGTVPGAATYRIQLSTSSAFGTTVADDSTPTAGTKAITGLTNSTTYYWRANSKNTGGTSAWSTGFSFTTIPAAPAAPVLSSPANAATVTTRTPTLTWGTVTGAVTYRVQLSTSSVFGTTVTDDSTLTTGTRAITATLSNGVYYWRANAKNTGGTSAWSTTLFSFTVSVTGIIAASPQYVPAGMGHNGVLEVYLANGSRVMELAYGASATRAQLLNAASKSLAKGYYTYRFRSADAQVEIVGKLIK